MCRDDINRKKTHREILNAAFTLFLPFLSFLHGIKTLLEEIRYYGNNVQLHSRTPKSSGRGLEVDASVCASIRNDEDRRRRILSDNSAGNLRQCDMPNSCAARILRRNEISSAHNTMRSPRTYIYLLCVCIWMRCVGHHVDFLRLHIVSSCPYLFTFLPRFFSLDSLSISRLVTSFGI